MTREQTKNRSWTNLAALAAYVALTLFMTWPLILRWNDHLASVDIDAWINPWATWWTRKILLEGGDLFFTDWLFYGHGVSLVFHSFSHVNTALELALRPFLSDLAAYNTMVLLAYILSGYGMYRLVQYLTRRNAPAFFAGLVYAFIPYRLAEGGHLVLVCTQWMPFFMLHLLQIVRDRRSASVLPAALFFVLNALTSWHLMILLTALAGLYAAYSLLFERHSSSARTWRDLGLLAVVAAVPLSPFFYTFIREQLTVPADYMGVLVGSGTDLLTFLLPPSQHPLFGPLLKASGWLIDPTRPFYLGILPMGLSLIAARANWKRYRFWGLLTLLCVILSVGSEVRIAGQRTGVFLPWAGPVIRILRDPYRMNTLVEFGLAVTSGLGLAVLLDTLPQEKARQRPWVLVSAAALLLFEYLPIPYPLTPAPLPAFYTELGDRPGAGAVLDLPLGRQPGKISMYYQTIHNRPIVDGVVSRTPPEAYEWARQQPALRSLLRCDQALPPADLAPLLPGLADLGIEYVVAHLHEPTGSESIAGWEAAQSQTPTYADDVIVAYETGGAAETLDTGRPQLLEACVAVRALTGDVERLTPGDTWQVTLEWTPQWTPQWMLAQRLEQTPPAPHTVRLELLDEQNMVVGRRDSSLRSATPISNWQAGTSYTGAFDLPLAPSLAPGRYRLQVTLLPPNWDGGPLLSAQVLEIDVVAE